MKASYHLIKPGDLSWRPRLIFKGSWQEFGFDSQTRCVR
jgi:hypothetical protein